MRKALTLALALSTAIATIHVNADGGGPVCTMSEIRWFGIDWVPVNFLPADGRLLKIQQNNALYALIGLTYGGDGVETFALPDLRGRTTIGYGQGPGLPEYTTGERVGITNTQIAIKNLPKHVHEYSPANTALQVTTGTTRPGTAVNVVTEVTHKTTPPPPEATEPTGKGEAMSNMQPSLTMTPAICVEGIFPTRP